MLWKKYRIPKKYWIPILIELVMIFIMIRLGDWVYQLEESRICTESINILSYVQDWDTGGWDGYSGPDKKDNTVDFLMHKVMKRISNVPIVFTNQAGIEDSVQDIVNCYGIYLELYDSEGNVIAKTTPHTLALGWISGDDEDNEKIEMMFLEDYFSEQEIEDCLAWIVPNEQCGIRRKFIIRDIAGYYNEDGRFIPVKVIFEVEGSDQRFILENSQMQNVVSGKELVHRRNWHIFYEETGEEYEETEEEIVEPGFISKYHFTTDTKANERAKDVVMQEGAKRGTEIVSGEKTGGYYNYDGTECYMSGILEGGEAAGYAFGMHIDTEYLILRTSFYKPTVKSIRLLCQLMAIVLIGIYLYMQKKERKIKEMRDTFLNAIAHEMKTPSAVIQNSVECVQAGIHPEKQEHYLDMIVQEASHMNELLNGMLVYTRASDAVYKLNKESYPLEKLAEQVCSHYSVIMEQKGITLQWVKQDHKVASYDVRLIGMVLDNFVSNAVKFCYQGGNICIYLEKRGIRIFNEGDGISEECAKHIWEPLYKGDASRTTVSGSSGMGLAISAAILDLHKAEYGMTNVPGGVEFYFYLNE